MGSEGEGGDTWRGIAPAMLLWWDESCSLIATARVRVLGKEEEERRVSMSSGKHNSSSSKYTTSCTCT